MESDFLLQVADLMGYIEPHHLKYGLYEARVNVQGARLESLTFDGREIIESAVIDGPFDAYWGDLLAPWPNRIADGSYAFGGKTYQLELNELSRGNSLHGLVKRLEWSVESKNESSMTLTVSDPGVDGYPFALDYRISYSLAADGMSILLETKNISGKTAPFGASIHPYLIADPRSTVNEWQLELPAEQYMNVDPKRLLPIGMDSVRTSAFDFRRIRTISDLFIDHAFRVKEDLDERVVRVVAPSGVGVAMHFDEESKWVQIHTADRDGDPSGRKSLAVEPMSCPPDAFNNGMDLVLIKPGEKYSIGWRIEALSSVKVGHQPL